MEHYNPWLALSTYEEKDQDKFKGREKDIECVLNMLQQSESIVCYAASGDGKSSLINAGVCPGMRKLGMFPLKISFTSAEYEGKGVPRKDDDSIDFDNLIWDKIEEGVKLYQREFVKKFNIQEDFLINFEKISKYEKIEKHNSLWWKLRTETIQIPFGEFDNIPVLIFDQFEEIFRASWKAEFFKWLEMLMRDVCPDVFLDKTDVVPGRKMFKTIFSLRYEYVGELDYWCSQKSYIPQLMQNRYFLRPLKRDQAISVIQEQKGIDNVSKKMSEEADLIVGNIVAKTQDPHHSSDEISAIILSLVCFVLYEKWSENIEYSLKDINLNAIIYEFYLDKLQKIGVPDDVRQALEDVLISSKNTRLRMPISDNRLQKVEISKYVYTAEGAPNLKSEHLVKLEFSNGEDYIEFIHDKLADTIFTNRENERAEKLAFHNLESRKKLWLLFALFLLVAQFIYVTVRSLTFNAWYIDDNVEYVDDNKLEVTQHNYKNYSEEDYIKATSLSLESDMCLLRLDCYGNVLYSNGSLVNYAHNAERLIFVHKFYLGDSLFFGGNTREVILLYPLNLSKIKCANKFTRIYVPKGDYDNCIIKGLRDNIQIKELGLLSLFWEKLKYEIHFQHTHLYGNEIPHSLWLVYFFYFLLIMYVTKKYWTIYELHGRVALWILGGIFLIILSIENIELYWWGKVDRIYLMVPFGITLLIWFLYEYIRKIRPNSIANRSNCCIIYCSENGKSIAIKLRKVLLDIRMEGDDDDFALDLSIVRYGEFHTDVAASSMEKSKQCIAVFDKCDIEDNNRLKSYVTLLESQKFLYPVIVGLDNTQNYLLPFDVQQFFQRKDIVFFHDVEQIDTKSDNILRILSSIKIVKKYGCVYKILWALIKMIIVFVCVAVVFWLIQLGRR